MTRLKSLGRIIGAAVALFAFTSFAAAQNLRVNYIPIIDVTPLFAAIDQGYFKDEGINIVLTPSTGGAAGIPGLMAGAYDVMFGNVVSTAIAEQQGFKLVVVGASTKLDPEAPNTSGIVARAADGIKGGKDLEGKTVAVNTRNNVIWLFARAWIAKTGGDPNKVTFKEVPFPQMLDALRGKQVDAAFMVDPFMTAAASDKETFSYIASPYKEVQPGVEIGHYITTRDYLDKNKDLLAKFSRAYRKGVVWYNSNLQNPELVRIISGFTKMQPEQVAKLSLQKMAEVVDPDTVAVTMKLMKDNGLLTRDIDVRGMTDPNAMK